MSETGCAREWPTESGPVLDALVAEKVMGWEAKQSRETGRPLGWFGDHRLQYGFTWSPSTNLTHAWDVVEKLHETGKRGFQVNYTFDPDCIDAPFLAQCYSGTNPMDDVEAWAETAPLAICLAALKSIQLPPPEPQP